jgi:hypothetical protein
MQRLEEIEQAKVVRWSHRRPVRALIPGLRWLFHPANGGKRHGITGAQMTALGVKKGVLDLILPVHQGNFLGLVIEMKHGKGKESPEQVEWIKHFIEQGWRVSTCYSAEEARADICEYFGIDRWSAPALDEPKA